MDADIPWATVQTTRAHIERLVAELAAARVDRERLFRVMSAAGMTTREIASHWSVSQPVVVYALNGGSYRDRARRARRVANHD